MKFQILHEIKGRLRIHIVQSRMTDRQADILQYYLEGCEMVLAAKVYERTQDAAISFSGERDAMLAALQKFSYEHVKMPDDVSELSGRRANREYLDKLAGKVLLRFGSRLLLPYSVGCAIAAVKSLKYIWKGIRSVCGCLLYTSPSPRDRG